MSVWKLGESLWQVAGQSYKCLCAWLLGTGLGQQVVGGLRRLNMCTWCEQCEQLLGKVTRKAAG